VAAYRPDLSDLWLNYIVGWGGTGGFTLGLIGAVVAVVLRLSGYRHVRQAPDLPGWEPGVEIAPLPNPLNWCGAWGSIGGFVGAGLGLVLWIHDRGVS
jgi:hypothetical protein